LLTVVEIANSLSGLEGGVRVPDTTSFLSDLLDRVGVGWVSWSDVLDRASLNTDDTNRDTGKTSTTDNNGTSPSTK